LEVKAGSNDIRLKLYYNGRGYYYQSYMQVAGVFGPSGPTVVQNPAGWGTMADRGIDPHDAIWSSVDSFHNGGFTYNPEDGLNDVLSAADTAALLASGARSVGTFTLPVCELNSGDFDLNSIDDFKDFLDGPGEEMSPGYFPFYCACRDKTDPQGNVFKDQVKDNVNLDGLCDYINYDPGTTYKNKIKK
jgi:hypothetical protein